MLVVADKYIPFLKGILEPFARVLYLEPEQITSDTIRDADALLIRTRTRCNSALLQGSRVSFIATATIGFDHIDTTYCDAHNISWTNSPGCNAQGVCDYVEAAINALIPQPHNNLTVGIIGVGHVGTLVAQMARKKGMRLLLSDPPKNLNTPLSVIAQESDIITFHTPLTTSGAYPTFHLCNQSFLSLCKPSALIINSARGGIVDENALLNVLSGNSKHLQVAIDTWENEPNINKQLLQNVNIGTYHIAGYTLQGKINATNQCLDALCRHFSLPSLQIPKKALPLQPDIENGWILQVDQQLRLAPDNFETLRETYKLR